MSKKKEAKEKKATKKYSKLQAVLQDMRDSGQRVSPPEPNEVDSAFVMQCLYMDSEGDGILFAELLMDKILYATSRQSWFVFQGNVWRRDNINLVLGLTRYLTDRYGEEIHKLEEKINESRRKNDSDDHKSFKAAADRKINRIQSKIKALRQDKGRNAALNFSHTFLNNPLSIEGTEFDKNPWYLGVKNGVVDLRSGELLEGSPEQLVSKQCSCEYKQDVDQGPWKEFLISIYNNDQELIKFIQRLFGYAATGDTRNHVFPFFLGKGRNGKSLLLASIMRVLADYAAVIPCELFLQTNQPKTAGQADPAVMKLEGLRLAISSEVEEGARFSAKNVKSYTGGDILEGRNPYDKELRNFNPSHLACMIGNHEPNPPAGDPAFWERTYLIEHPVHFVKENPTGEFEKLADPCMEEKLQGMDEQILAWLIEGALMWQANGYQLSPPDSILKATEEYKEGADWLGQWLTECCLVDENITTGSTELYTAFVVWYQEHIDAKKSKTPSQKVFGAKLGKRDGITPKRKTSGSYYKGLRLNIDWQQRMLRAAHNTENEG